MSDKQNVMIVSNAMLIEDLRHLAIKASNSAVSADNIVEYRRAGQMFIDFATRTVLTPGELQVELKETHPTTPTLVDVFINFMRAGERLMENARKGVSIEQKGA